MKLPAPRESKTPSKKISRATTAPSRKMSIRKVLKEKFGLRQLRPGQSEVIDAVLARQNVLAVMPTGAGKSLCFQLPAMMLEGKTLVVSPLIALMKDQKEHLDKLDLPAVELNSTLSSIAQKQNLNLVATNATEFIYVTPERLISEEFLRSVSNLKIDMMVIDEAHCISEWGHDFRPAYLRVREARDRLGKPQILALTATATPQVIEDIKKQLALPDLTVFSSGVLRDNLFYEAVHADNEADKKLKLLELLKDNSGSKIVYCASVKSVNELYAELETQGFLVDKYHGKLKADERTENRQRFMKANDRTMIATNAFGMGIDKPDIRLIIHFQFPGSIEAYYQESGRAGRDGQAAKCTLIYLKKDKSTQNFFLAGKYPTTTDLRELYGYCCRAAVARKALSEKELIEAEILAKTKIRVLLSMLVENEVISRNEDRLTLHRDNLNEVQLDRLMEAYREKKMADDEKLKKMVIYAQSALCRWKFLLNYFDHRADWERCGHCDNCAKQSSHLVEIKS